MTSTNNNNIDHYLDALQALKYLLLQEGEYYENWIQAMKRDINEWKISRNSKIHLGNYGGMGSFNDIALGPYFDDIKSVAYHLANDPSAIDSVEASMGTLGQQLNGRHCPNCDFKEVFITEIRQFTNNQFVRTEVLEHFRKGKLLELVKARRKFDWSNLDFVYEKAIDLAKNSGINLVKEHPWTDNCPKCNELGIELYHWVLNDKEDQFVPHGLDANDLPDSIKSAFK